MDEDDHRRAQEEMNALSLRHLQQLKDSKKFVNRLISMLYKALAVGIVLGLISLVPPQLPSFVGQIRRAVFARTWDVVNVLLVALAISYGVLGRGGRQETEGQIDEIEGREEYEGRVFDYDSVNRRRGLLDPNVESSESVVVESSSRRGLLDRNVESSESVVVESSSLYEHEYAYEYPVAVAAPPLRRIRSSFSYQDLSEASRAWDDSNPPRAMDDTDWVRRSRRAPEDSKDNTFGDSVPKSNGVGDSAKASNGREDSTIGSEKPNKRGAVLVSEDIHCPKEAEVNPQDFDISAQVKDNIVTEEQCKLPPAAPSSPRNASSERDSNTRPPSPPKNMNSLSYQSEKRRRKPPSPPPPPPPPPHPPPPPPPCNPPALEPHLPKQMIRPAPDSNPHHSHEKPEKPEKPKKIEKIKSDKKFPVGPIPNPPNPSPLPTEIPNHESGRGRSKDDSKHRPSEQKPSRSTIVNAFGLIPQSERRNKKNPIPTPPVPPPPPPPLSSTLHKWFQSYNKKDPKHKSKDSEPSPRHRSDKSRRKVHSSNSPPSPPPPPPAHIYTTEPMYPKKRASEKHEKPKPPIYSTDSNYPKNVETSEKIEALKPPVCTPDPGYQKDEGFEEIAVAKKTSGRRNSSEYWKANVSGDAITTEPRYQKDEGFEVIAVAKKTSGRRNSSEYWKANASGDSITPDPRYQNDEGFDEIAVSKRVSGRRNSSEYWKENVSGDAKAMEKLAERKSSSIPLPPPPPPPFPLVEHHWSFYDDPKPQKKKTTSPEELAEAESVQEPEIGWASVFRKQFSLDNADSPFCPSPSPDEVNRKADAFIARMHQQLRLQKSNSGQGRVN